MGSEKQFEQQIKKFLDEEAAWWVKFFANGYTRSGVPDLLCCVNGYFVAIEVKAQYGKPSPLQEYNCNKIREAGGLAFIVYPSGFEKLKLIIYGLNCDRVTKDMPLVLK